MDITENFLSESETAEVLRVKKETLRNWRCQRKGPPRIKIGRKIFYRREALVAWMQSQEKAVAAPAPLRSRLARGGR